MSRRRKSRGAHVRQKAPGQEGQERLPWGEPAHEQEQQAPGQGEVRRVHEEVRPQVVRPEDGGGKRPQEHERAVRVGDVQDPLRRERDVQPLVGAPEVRGRTHANCDQKTARRPRRATAAARRSQTRGSARRMGRIPGRRGRGRGESRQRTCPGPARAGGSASRRRAGPRARPPRGACRWPGGPARRVRPPWPSTRRRSCRG